MKKKELKSQLHECQVENVQLQRQVLSLVETIKDYKVVVNNAEEINLSYKTLLANSARIELSKLPDDELLEVIS